MDKMLNIVHFPQSILWYFGAAKEESAHRYLIPWRSNVTTNKNRANRTYRLNVMRSLWTLQIQNETKTNDNVLISKSNFKITTIRDFVQFAQTRGGKIIATNEWTNFIIIIIINTKSVRNTSYLFLINSFLKWKTNKKILIYTKPLAKRRWKNIIIKTSFKVEQTNNLLSF